MRIRGSLVILIVSLWSTVAEGQVVTAFYAGASGWPLPTSQPGTWFALDFGQPGQFPPEAPMRTVMLHISLNPGVFRNPGTPPMGDLVIQLDGLPEEYHFPSQSSGLVSHSFYDPDYFSPPSGPNSIIPQTWVGAMAEGHLKGRFWVEDFNAENTTSNWGLGMMATVLIPEPGSGLLAFFALVGLTLLKRRRR